ncbi:MAG: FtsB family cell division protein [Chitinophagales bacterium]
MDQLKDQLQTLFQNIPNSFKSKYVLTGFIFLTWMFLFDTNTIPSQFRLSMQIEEMEDKKEYYREEIKVVNQSLEDLLTNQTSQEKFARENYLMKKKNEDVFVIEYK